MNYTSDEKGANATMLGGNSETMLPTLPFGGINAPLRSDDGQLYAPSAYSY